MKNQKKERKEDRKESSKDKKNFQSLGMLMNKKVMKQKGK